VPVIVTPLVDDPQRERYAARPAESTAADCARGLRRLGVENARGLSPREEPIMAKGQRKSNKEVRKPKAEKTPKQNASQPSLKPGWIKGLENMKNT
jgi:NADPH-dependent glutamate synthase beta subunit-like oxidoreductase